MIFAVRHFSFTLIRCNIKSWANIFLIYVLTCPTEYTFSSYQFCQYTIYKRRWIICAVLFCQFHRLVDCNFRLHIFLIQHFIHCQTDQCQINFSHSSCFPAFWYLIDLRVDLLKLFRNLFYFSKIYVLSFSFQLQASSSHNAICSDISSWL